MICLRPWFCECRFSTPTWVSGHSHHSPSGKDQRFRIGRVHNHVNDTGFFVDKMDPVPAFSPIGCFESAPVATGPI